MYFYLFISWLKLYFFHSVYLVIKEKSIKFKGHITELLQTKKSYFYLPDSKQLKVKTYYNPI